jgi:hypothetical protein
MVYLVLSIEIKATAAEVLFQKNRDSGHPALQAALASEHSPSEQDSGLPWRLAFLSKENLA